MNLRAIKDKLYYYFAEKNWGVRREYGPYVDAHQEEHIKQPWKHWWLLIRLNWHYRIMRQNSFLIEKKKNNKSEPVPCVYVPESSRSKRQELLKTAKQLLQYDIISFDVFDTLVLRSLDKPTMVFQLLEQKHRIFNFAKLRKKAEDDMRASCAEKYGHRDITIYDIYQYIEQESGLNAAYGIEIELETELAVCFANPYMKMIYEILKQQKKTSLITSDMYLPQSMMERILHKCGYFGYDKLYVSCDYKKSKREGALFHVIAQEWGENVKICHVGDNPVSDMSSAEKAGWSTFFYHNVNKIGKFFRPKGMSPLIGSAYAGIVNAHLHSTETIFSRQYEFGFLYAGIYALGYVNWIHQFLVSHGQEKVIFLARDSDILKDIYDMLYSDIPSEYLYWGRLPSFKYSLKNDRHSFIQRNIMDRVNRKSKLSIGKLLELLDISFLLNQLTQYDLSVEDMLEESNKEQVRQLFVDNIAAIEESYEEEKNICRKYLETVIGDAEKITIVDIGWKGTEPQALKKLIENEWKLTDQVSCLMAGAYGNNWNVQDGTFSVYMFSPVHNTNHLNHLKKNISYYTLEVEMFGRMRCEPRFKGFGIKNNHFAMSFETLLVENKYDMKEIKRGMMDFINLYQKHFIEFPYLFNISGHDAYSPVRMLERRFKYLDNVFAEHVIELDAGDNYDGLRSFKQYFEENRV